MDIRHLEYFLEVVRQRSFSKAATALHVTQPSISKMIKSLEDELGVPLVYRNAKHVELTDAGQAVLEKAQQISALFQNLSLELDGVINLKSGKIRIGLPPIAASTVFPQIMGEFNKAYPQIQLQLFEAGSKRIELGVIDGTLDLGVICAIPAKEEFFELYSFVKDPLRIILHPDHRLASEKALAISDLANESFVLYSEDFSLYDKIMTRCHESGFQPKIICETSQREFMTQMVAANLGVALLPKNICDELDPKQIKAIPLHDPQIYLHLSIVRRKDRYLSFAARKWLDFTTSLLDNHTLKRNGENNA